MSSEFKLPELGENIETIQVTKVLVAPGDTIEQEQSLFEVETDKAAIEVPSTVSGTVAEVLVKEGDEIAVGQPLLTVGESEAAASQPSAFTPQPSTSPTPYDVPAAPAARRNQRLMFLARDDRVLEEAAGIADDRGVGQLAAPDRYNGIEDGARIRPHHAPLLQFPGDVRVAFHRTPPPG